MIRTITVVLAFLLTTSSVALAEDRESSLPNLGFKPYQYQPWHRVDMNISPQVYEERYRQNQRIVLKNLMSYSNYMLELVGMPEQGINLMGATIGMAINGPKLDMNISKTLSFELKDVDISERTLYFEVKLDW